jgi:hypothetical protein
MMQAQTPMLLLVLLLVVMVTVRSLQLGRQAAMKSSRELCNKRKAAIPTASVSRALLAAD